MSNFNSVVLVGNLVRDVDLRYTPGGDAVASFDLAINSYYTDKAKKKQEDTTFVSVTVWRKQAETCAEWLKKGKSVLIQGRLKQERWKGKDNENKQRLVVVASVVRFLSPMDKKQDQPTMAEDVQSADLGDDRDQQ